MTVAAVAIMSAMVLSGCLASQMPTAPTSEPTTSTAPTEKPITRPSETPTNKPTGAPDGWESFDLCGHEYGVEWQWVDGFPAAEMEANGLYPECGELWLASRGSSESLLSTMVEDVPAQRIRDFGVSLEESGYVLTHSTFDPDSPPDNSYFGNLVYYLDGNDGYDATGIVIEAYGDDVDDDDFEIYVDYFSPETRMFK